MACAGEESDGKSLSEPADTLLQGHKDKIKKDTKGPEVCKFFLTGRCHFGDRCRLSHSVNGSAACKTVQSKEKDIKNRKTWKISSRLEDADGESKEPEKKPRMRTADDVISRILWDSSVDPGDFIVGHLDRFLGVLERPFSDFAWNTQVCDCDFSEEMAIPRHRIQYFSYKGQRVWDKDSRTDLVFGSTGQTVVPPFDREEQPQENVAPEARQQVEEASIEKNVQEESGEHGLTVTLAGGTVSELSSGASEDCSTNRPMAASLAQEASRLSISPSAKQVATEEEWNSWDEEEGEEEKENTQTALSIPERPRSGRPPPRRPTHFICFRVNTPAALMAFQRVQKKVLSHLPESEPYWVSPATLHVTLSLLVLQDPTELCAAIDLFRSVVKSLYKPPISVSFPTKLKHFHGRVLHLPPQPLSDVQNLNSPIQQAFWEKGWLHRHSRCPNYHLTLAKLNDEVKDRMFSEVGLIKLAKDVNFGKLEVDKLYLCAISSRQTESSFYQIMCTVQLPMP